MYKAKSEKKDDFLLNVLQYQQTFQLENKMTNKIPWELKSTSFHDSVFIVIPISIIYIICLISYQNYNVMIKSNRFDDLLSIGLLDKIRNMSIIQIECILIVFILISLFFALIQLVLILCFTKLFIFGAISLNLSLGISAMIYFYKEQLWKYFSGSLIFTLLIIFSSWKLHNRVKFSINIMNLASKLIQTNPSIWFIYVGAILIGSAVSLVYFFAVYCVISTLDKNLEKEKLYQLYFFLLFVGLYLNDINRNSVQLIVGSICAKWYFKSEVSTIIALYNTFVKCFGSICLGSLLATTITVLKDIFILMKPSNNALNFTLLKPIWKLIKYILFVIEIGVKYFNQYSISYMAIYSKGYIKSSFKLFNIYNFKGYDTLINDSIIKIILRLYIVFSGILGCLTAVWCIHLFDLNLSLSSSHSIIIIVISGFMSMQISTILSIILNGIVHVLLICLVEHQDVLAQEHYSDKDIQSIQPYLTPYPAYKV